MFICDRRISEMWFKYRYSWIFRVEIILTYILLTAIELPPGGSSTVQYSTHLHTNSTQNNTNNNFGWKAFWDSNPDWSN